MKADNKGKNSFKGNTKNVAGVVMKNGMGNNIRIIAACLILIFVVMFLFQLFRPSVKAAVSDSDIDENIRTVEALQVAEIKTIEKAVKQIEDSYKHDSASGIRIKYRRKFDGSVIMGDSLTEGLVVYGWLPKSIVFSDIGGSISMGESKFDKAAQTLPKQAFFAYGMNDMGNYAGDADAFIKQYKKLLNQFSETSPDTKLNVCSITAPTKAAMKGNKSIRNYKKFNKALKKMCKDEGYNFIDVTDILVENPDLYEGDGIHASPAYYPYWMKRVVSKSGL